MARKQDMLVITGQTADGILIVDAFKMVDTSGLPLDVVIDELRGRRMMPDWIRYYEDSLAGGQAPDRIMLRMEGAIGETYGPAFREQWAETMGGYLAVRDKYRALKGFTK